MTMETLIHTAYQDDHGNTNPYLSPQVTKETLIHMSHQDDQGNTNPYLSLRWPQKH